MCRHNITTWRCSSRTGKVPHSKRSVQWWSEGGGQMSVESAAVLLLRACAVSAEQFQTLTQPFGLRLPATEAELAQTSHHLRRRGHIVERYPNNIASGLRSHMGAHYSQAFPAQPDGPEEPSSMEQPWAPLSVLLLPPGMQLRDNSRTGHSRLIPKKLINRIQKEALAPLLWHTGACFAPCGSQEG